MQQPPFASAVVCITLVTWFAISTQGSSVEDDNNVGLHVRRDFSEPLRQQGSSNNHLTLIKQRYVARRPGVRHRSDQRVRPGTPLLDQIRQNRRTVDVIKDLQASWEIDEILDAIKRSPQKATSNAKNSQNVLLKKKRHNKDDDGLKSNKDLDLDTIIAATSNFPEKLNCRVINPFPPPDQHIFCCEKTVLCDCPRPMGVCKADDDNDTEDASGLNEGPAAEASGNGARDD